MAIALVGATVHTGQGPPLENATIVIDGARVHAVGTKLRPPDGATVIDVSGMVITPGLVAVGTRLGFDVVAHQQGADPAAVVFDALEAARARGADLLLIDTAGRLHNKQNLMDELTKIRRVLERQLGRGPDEVALVLDAAALEGRRAAQRAWLRGRWEKEGLPGVVGSRLLQVGDTIGGLRVRRIGMAEVVLAGLDTMWTLKMRRPWD